jgi:Glutaredoxin and related proteins
MKLYTKTVCPRCLWIKSEAQRSGKQVDIVNIDHDEAARERLVQAGIKSVPVLEADGRFWIDIEDMMEKLGVANG